MQITLNGKPRTIPDDATILTLLEELDMHPQRVAVEVNREIIKRDRYAEHRLGENDEVEILQFVGGGAS